VSSMKKGLRRVAVVAVATLVAAPALATVASATSTFAFDRLAGVDRYATSVETAASYGASTNVILASGVAGHYPDALTASYLAGFKKAPIMLTKLAATPANVLARIAASGATDVWLIGGTGVISAAQETALATTYTVHRLGGLDRYATATAVIGAPGVAASTTHTALLATGVNFPDAIAGGSLSYVKGMPMAITATAAMNAAELAALKTAGVTNVIALGGPTVVSDAVLAQLTAASITSTRIFGADRAETSSKLADYMITSQGFLNTAVNVASGYEWGTGADALGGAPLSGKEVRPTLITNADTVVGPGVLGFLTAHCSTLASGHIFGGLGAVSAASEAAMQAAGRCAPTTSNQTFTVTPTSTTSVLCTKTVTYTVSGLTAGDALRLTLVDPALISGSTFSFAAGNRTADLTTAGNVSISKINGVTLAGDAATRSFTAVSSTLTFTVKSTACGAQAIPVVFNNNDGDNALAVNLAGAPTEPSGIGGEVDFTFAPMSVPPENGDAAFAGANVVGINGTTSFSTDAVDNGGSLMTLATDVYKLNAATITKAQFYSILNGGGAGTGDVVTVAYVNGADATTPSTFTITTDRFPSNADANAALANPTAVGSLVTVKYYNPPTTTIGGTTFTLQRAPVVTSVVGTYVTVSTGPVSSYAMQTFTETPAAGTYVYRLKYTAPAFSGAAATGGPAAGGLVGGYPTVTVPVVAALAAPEVLRTYTTTNTTQVNYLGAGDVVKIVFDRAVTAPVIGASFMLTDANVFTYRASTGVADGSSTFSVNTTAEVVDGASIGAGQVLTVTILNDPAAAEAFTTTTPVIKTFTGVGNSEGNATPDGNGLITS